MKTLLQQVRELGPNKNISVITDDQYELGLAWARGEVSIREITTVLKYKNVNSTYGFLSKCFKKLIQSNQH